VAAYIPKVLNTINPKYKKALEGFTDKEPVNTIRIVAPNEKVINFSYPEQGFVCKRIYFDNFLLELAKKLPNVTLFLNTPVHNVTVDDKGVMIDAGESLKIESSLVIGCDGAFSTVRKKLTDTKMDLKHNMIAARAYFKNVKGIPESTYELHFLKDVFPGYFWIFQLPGNYANVGVGMLSQTVSEKRINLLKKLISIIENTSYLKNRFEDAEIMGKVEGYSLPLGSRELAISGNRFMLCGDAASLINPLTGEGIGQAMVSGRYAGWHAEKCFAQNNFTAPFMQQYDKMMQDKFRSKNRKAYLARKIIQDRKWIFNLVVNLCLNNKFIYKKLKGFF
jgi:flavin-dependent dehydrogenase